MQEDVTIEAIHGSDARYSVHLPLPPVRQRVQA